MANHSGIIDSGTVFEIVPNTRKVTVPTLYKVIGTVGDHLSEQLTFRCPKLIDGHDIAGCARHYITWKNVNQQVGHDELNIVDSDDEYIYFNWLVRDGLTAAKGLVSFSVHFEDLDENDNVCYRWSTTTCNDCEVLEGINAALGTYEAIYVAGDTLVFADYNSVTDETLTLETNGLIPEGIMEITENGIHDVGEYAQVNVAVDKSSGTKVITTNGTHDVTNFAQADVAVPFDTPSISVASGVVTATANGVTSNFELEKPIVKIGTDGKITASANGITIEGQVNTSDDVDLVPANIKKGVNILGVDGSYDPLPLVSGSIKMHNASRAFNARVYFSGRVLNQPETDLSNYIFVTSESSLTQVQFVKDLPILISIYKYYPDQELSLMGSGWEKIDDNLCGARGDSQYLIYTIRPTSGTNDVSIIIEDADIAVG